MLKLRIKNGDDIAKYKAQKSVCRLCDNVTQSSCVGILNANQTLYCKNKNQYKRVAHKTKNFEFIYCIQRILGRSAYHGFSAGKFWVLGHFRCIALWCGWVVSFNEQQWTSVENIVNRSDLLSFVKDITAKRVRLIYLEFSKKMFIDKHLVAVAALHELFVSYSHGETRLLLI